MRRVADPATHAALRDAIIARYKSYVAHTCPQAYPASAISAAERQAIEDQWPTYPFRDKAEWGNYGKGHLDLRRDITMGYGYRCKDIRVWELTAYEFIADWEVIHVTLPRMEQWGDTEHVVVVTKPARVGDKLEPGVHYRAKDGGVDEDGREWLPLLRSSKRELSFTHAYVLRRRLRPVAPSADFHSGVLGVAEVLNGLHRQWTYSLADADTAVPHVSKLCAEGQTGWAGLLGWLREHKPTSEIMRQRLLKMAQRYIGREHADEGDDDEKIDRANEPPAFQIDAQYYRTDLVQIRVPEKQDPSKTADGVAASAQLTQAPRMTKGALLHSKLYAATAQTVADAKKWQERWRGEVDDDAPLLPVAAGAGGQTPELAVKRSDPAGVRANFAAAVRDFEATAAAKGGKLHAEQRALIKRFEQRAIAEAGGGDSEPLLTFVHGEPGVSKSSTLQTAVRALEASGQRCAVVAADWSAASLYKGAGAQTSSMHNFMGWKAKGYSSEKQAEAWLKEFVQRLMYRRTDSGELIGPCP
eukprot:gene10305-7981_t